MKRIIKFLFLIFIITKAPAQGIDSVTLSMLKVNFAVPDMPAFKALGTDPSNLLKPSTPMAFAMTMSELYQDRKFLLPKAFAVEISPALLLNSKKGPVQLKKYMERSIANSFRVSLGTSVDTLLSSTARKLGLGFRISVINKGDLTSDLTQLKKISELLERFRR